jgi:hypothetical protein
MTTRLAATAGAADLRAAGEERRGTSGRGAARRNTGVDAEEERP